jgi:hypothetical protein
VLQFVRPDIGHLSGCQPLLFVHVAEDPLDEPLIGHARIARRIADCDNEVVRRHCLGQRDWRGETARPPGRPDPQVRNVRFRRCRNPQDGLDRELEAGAAFELFEEIDLRRLRAAVDAEPEHEAVLRAASEFAGDVTVGHDDVVGDQPAGPDPRKVDVVLQLDAADRRNHKVENRARVVDARSPDVAVRPEKLGRDSVVAHRQHRSRAGADDGLGNTPLVRRHFLVNRLRCGKRLDDRFRCRSRDGNGRSAPRRAFPLRLNLLEDFGRLARNREDRLVPSGIRRLLAQLPMQIGIAFLVLIDGFENLAALRHLHGANPPKYWGWEAQV